jgi:hypothetical protein
MLDSSTARLVVLHADADAELLHDLHIRLAVPQRNGTLSVWDRTQYEFGISTSDQLAKQLAEAQIIVLLLSADYLAQYPDELDHVMTAASAGTAVVPILCRPVDLSHTRLAGMPVLPQKGTVRTARNRDAIWVSIVQRIVQVAATIVKVGRPKPESRPSSMPALETDSHTPLTVLFLSASPKDAHAVDVGRIVKHIDQALSHRGVAGRFRLVSHGAVTLDELPRLLLQHQPTVVHIVGHGTKTGQVVFEDREGKSRSAPQQALAELFAVLNRDGRIRCVLLHCCYSEPQAKALSQHVDCVLGIEGKIHEFSADSFSTAFYTGLAAGQSVGLACKLGEVQVKLMEDHPVRVAVHVRPPLLADDLHIDATPTPRSGQHGS